MKKRLGDALIEKGLAQDKNSAFIIVTEGRILVNGQKAVSPSQLVGEGAKIEVRESQKYVGRGAYKLEAALNYFKIDVKDKICLDIGSATGGFVEVLLNHGAKRVFAVDTAYGKLALKLRQNSKVVVMEETDIRDLEKLPETVSLVTIDVSLISLKNILPHVGCFLERGGEVVALFKPQYETRDPKILKHGVIKDDEAREKLLSDFISWAEVSRWKIKGKITSPISGSKGNIEYLLYITL
ncbi:MAG: hypothetical protein A3G49_04165 [Candidatus Sungbacteria bacterium RIFCSPLOWO2_12_FULL_41_11]|uniref:RNA-binding S4 domain-containing protein n=1 Tax=Candidatus Sungbacteria bacterium RIFCSPLOWO2_12_FULL_41_11 TaxID=1802286 RepID=A0A1G2LTA6_9BACT|nr:MAG: Hemolysin A [Parcubacteria group bacterium GW2011_GWA2_42_14]OGZ99330.1 MAG: hypothetical protein A3D41_02630 [Candidatus Sungbacteria bacterium RIFCSPHIGHO2_02_FULL_41_12b]OHA14856.1 MAG: hypothetical protein A3G49_04165 [Candidatus Sungbacteria bacterium RIFCSPLOWO2_12_FULL_41_11]